MNWEAIGAVGEVLGAGGVIVTLGYLAIQIRQNTRAVRTQVNQSRADLAVSAALLTADSAHLPSILVKVREGQALTEEESERFGHWFRSFNRIQDNLLRQHREGWLDDQMPRDIGSAITLEIVGSNHAMAIWEQTKEMYSQPYIEFVDQRIAEHRASAERASDRGK